MILGHGTYNMHTIKTHPGVATVWHVLQPWRLTLQFPLSFWVSVYGTRASLHSKEMSLSSSRKSFHTVSWRIRIFNCIEEEPRFFFPIELNPTFQISDYLQFNCTQYTI
jgi:hypothetical protein